MSLLCAGVDATHQATPPTPTPPGLSPTRPSGGVFGFRSNSSTLLVRVIPGRPGVALRQRWAPGRGATAPERQSTPPPGETSESPGRPSENSLRWSRFKYCRCRCNDIFELNKTEQGSRAEILARAYSPDFPVCVFSSL